MTTISNLANTATSTPSAATNGRLPGDEVRRRDAVIARAVAAGKIPAHMGPGLRRQLDTQPAEVERVLGIHAVAASTNPAGSEQMAQRLAGQPLAREATGANQTAQRLAGQPTTRGSAT